MVSSGPRLDPPPARAATIAALTLTLSFCGLCTGSAGAETVKVRADDRHGRVLVFSPYGIRPEALRSAKLRHRGRSRPLALPAVRSEARRGTVRVRVSRRMVRRLRGATHSRERQLLRRWILLMSVQPPPSASDILISDERLATLPVSGSAWGYMRRQADLARWHLDTRGRPSDASPWLSNYNGSRYVRRPGVQTLGAALVYARTGQRAYRDLVVRANRYLIGSENAVSTDGTAANDRALATARNISAYVLAASLVGMSPTVTGSRPGHGTTSWHRWLTALRTTRIGTLATCNSLRACSNRRAHNWGAFATAARIAIDVYLRDEADLGTAIGRYKRFLGESRGGRQWRASRAFDRTYACTPYGAEWTAINPSACGTGKDGLIVEDISRSAGSFDSYDKAGVAYTMESYQALLLSAIMLERRGHEPFAWGDQALLRVMQWLEREDKEQGNGSTVELHQSWVANHFYREDFATVPAGMGRSLGFTDWLFAR